MKKAIFTKGLIGVLAVVMTCLFAIVFFGNQDQIKANEEAYEWESNDIITEATVVTVNTVINGSLSESGDVDWFAFDLPEDGMVCVSFDHAYIDNSDILWKTSILDGSDIMVSENAWKGNSTVVGYGTKTGLDAGRHYLRVKTWYSWNHSSEAYRITIEYTPSNQWERGLNETIVTADSISVNTEISGSLASSGDKDWYTFTIPENGVYSITFSNDYIDSSDAFWETSLYTSSNEYIDKYTWAGNALKPLESNKVGIPAGTYCLLVKVVYNWAHSDGVYTFKINYLESKSWEKEFNDKIVDANEISLNTIYHGTIMSTSDNDWYAMNIGKAGKIRLMFEHDYEDSNDCFWNVSIRNSDGNTLLDDGFAGNGIGEKYLDELAVVSGVYYLVLRPRYSWAWSNRDYTFSIDYTSGKSFDTPRIDLDKKAGTNQVGSGSSVKDDKENDSVSADTGSGNASAKIGTTFTVGALKYKVTAEDEVTVVGAATKADSITIPDEVSSGGVDYTVIAIAKNSFKKNTSLKKLTIEADLDYIGENAFDSCKALTTLTIKGDVYTIKKKAFYNCKKLASITISTDSLEKVEDKAFSRISSKVSIKVPSSLADAYKKLLQKGGMPSSGKTSTQAATDKKTSYDFSNAQKGDVIKF